MKYKPSCLKCVVSGCAEKKSKNIHLFGFPKNDLDIWCQNLKLDPSTLKTSTRICSRHFSAECLGDGKLRVGAYPTINLGIQNDDHVIYPVLSGTKKKTLRVCNVPQCKTAHPSTLFRFPSEKTKRQEWLERCGMINDARRELFICEKHFDAAMIGKGRLNRNAIPNREGEEGQLNKSAIPNRETEEGGLNKNAIANRVAKESQAEDLIDIKSQLEDLNEIKFFFPFGSNVDNKVTCTNCEMFCKNMLFYRKRCSQLRDRLKRVERELSERNNISKIY